MAKSSLKGFLSLANLSRVGVSTLLIWLLDACSTHTLPTTSESTTPSPTPSPSASPTPTPTPTGTPNMTLRYLDSTNANNPLPLTNVSDYDGVGLFDLIHNCPATGSTVDYVFKITNSGDGPLTSSSATPVAVTITESGAPTQTGTINTFTLTTTQPSFPIAPGESSTFTVTYNYNADGNNIGGAGSCLMGWETSPWRINIGSLNFRLVIQTNDPTNSTLTNDLIIWGYC